MNWISFWSFVKEHLDKWSQCLTFIWTAFICSGDYWLPSPMPRGDLLDPEHPGHSLFTNLPSGRLSVPAPTDLNTASSLWLWKGSCRNYLYITFLTAHIYYLYIFICTICIIYISFICLFLSLWHCSCYKRCCQNFIIFLHDDNKASKIKLGNIVLKFKL